MATYKRQRYLLMTTDPVHIGTGGYRLGRVDNSIVREPGTRVPKIPGTSLHGAARSYAAQLYETPEAAGQSQDEVKSPDQNPVCYTFGYIKKTSNQAYSGVVNIFDAHIVLFPVHSMAGPVWVSTLRRLKEAQFKVDKDGTEVSEEPASGTALLTWERTDALNLGWLMVDIDKQKITIDALDGKNESDGKNGERWKAVADRIVLVNEALFSQVVNSNLEVRTSVAIDPERGAAEDKALFTYEAIPRATFLTVEVVLDNYRESFPSGEYLNKRKGEIDTELASGIDEKKKRSLEKEKKNIESALQHLSKLKNNAPKSWQDPLDVVKAGLQMIEWLGVGGMGTRGFGRMAIVGEPLEQAYDEEAWQ